MEEKDFENAVENAFDVPDDNKKECITDDECLCEDDGQCDACECVEDAKCCFTKIKSFVCEHKCVIAAAAAAVAAVVGAIVLICSLKKKNDDKYYHFKNLRIPKNIVNIKIPKN